MSKDKEKREKNMYQRTGKVIFAKDGKGGYTPKISIPISWLRDMGITDAERGIELQYDEKSKGFYVIKEGKRKDVNLAYKYDKKNKAMIIGKKYDDGKHDLHRKYLKSKHWRIKGYKTLNK